MDSQFSYVHLVESRFVDVFGTLEDGEVELPDDDIEVPLEQQPPTQEEEEEAKFNGTPEAENQWTDLDLKF
ncbi:uncharacterized protein VTP21DRAFT_6279 [Calcarisporiella thermophila]|uniref:uncharacterized protein n=1 Tax=Calcarisporiella thermophila TaxID=911321 RepID=UPI00374257D0